MSRSSAARQSAESRRCPKCDRKSATKIVVHDGQVVTYCSYNDCGYERATDLTA